ncbi:3812_t:CDS:2 [Dentiscutata erythropus]|uniref:3812_t:CDS:1 n=1 Tax=Dentiscutata erythropus TaxID=1348616 RepID=A0A9N8V7Q1_9GLOM|nr:3812_t:CDS:2 [Dentiscutata erythropus]
MVSGRTGKEVDGCLRLIKKTKVASDGTSSDENRDIIIEVSGLVK